MTKMTRAALLTTQPAQAQSGISTATVTAPAQPNTILLPTAEKIDREVWHPSDKGCFAIRNVTRPIVSNGALETVTASAVIPSILPLSRALQNPVQRLGHDCARKTDLISAFPAYTAHYPTPFKKVGDV